MTEIRVEIVSQIASFPGAFTQKPPYLRDKLGHCDHPALIIWLPNTTPDMTGALSQTQVSTLELCFP